MPHNHFRILYHTHICKVNERQVKFCSTHSSSKTKQVSRSTFQKQQTDICSPKSRG
nr:MAG TPA: hypothetical protein [Caudoviricetes sp.]